MKELFFKKISKLNNKNGNVFKFLQVGLNIKKIEEIYFTEIKFKKIKCWKKHTQNNLRLYVIKGKIRLVFFKNKKFQWFDINEMSKEYIYIPKNTIFGFQGLSHQNLILCSLEKKHSDKEVINYSKETFSFKYWKK